jgi:hypothetical protein
MRRAFAIGVGAVALALPAPPALAASQLRHFEGTLPPVGVPSQPQAGGVLRLDVVFKDKRGRGKFTPRTLIAVNTDGMPLSCTNQKGQSTSKGMLTGSFPLEAKFQATGRKPGQAKPKRNSYSFSTSSVFTSFAGTIGTRLYKVQGRGPVLAFSTLTVDRVDLQPGHENCSSNGPRGASGTQCRRSTEANPLPLCRID